MIVFRSGSHYSNYLKELSDIFVVTFLLRVRGEDLFIKSEATTRTRLA